MVREAGAWKQNRFCGRTALAGFATWLKVLMASCISAPATCTQQCQIIPATIASSEPIHDVWSRQRPKKTKGKAFRLALPPVIRSVAIVIVIFFTLVLIWQ